MRMVDCSIFDIEQAFNQGKVIVGFGAGQSFNLFCQMFYEKSPERYFKAIVDSDEKRHGTYREIGNVRIPVYSIVDAIEKLESIDIIIITSLYLEEICSQLSEMHEINNAIICFYGFIIDKYSDSKLSSSPSIDLIPHDGVVEIPKIIHYCWFGKSKIPDTYREWMKSWKKYCPDFEIVEWNESNYDVYKNQYMAEAYETKKWGFVPDYARLDIIFRHGGIYLDTDVEILRDFSPLLHQQGFCGFQDEYYIALGLGFGAKKKNPCVFAMREDYNNRHFTNNGILNLTSSPVYQSDVLDGFGLKRNGSFQRLEAMNIYPKCFFSPMNHYNRKVIMNDMTFAIHHFSGSWINPKLALEWNGFPKLYQNFVSSTCE